jgi:hypothetical protein
MIAGEKNESSASTLFSSGNNDSSPIPLIAQCFKSKLSLLKVSQVSTNLDSDFSGQFQIFNQ